MGMGNFDSQKVECVENIYFCSLTLLQNIYFFNNKDSLAL